MGLGERRDPSFVRMVTSILVVVMVTIGARDELFVFVCVSEMALAIGLRGMGHLVGRVPLQTKAELDFGYHKQQEGSRG